MMGRPKDFWNVSLPPLPSILDWQKTQSEIVASAFVALINEAALRRTPWRKSSIAVLSPRLTGVILGAVWESLTG